MALTKVTSRVSVFPTTMGYVVLYMNIATVLSVSAADYGRDVERRDLQWRHQPIPPANLDGCYPCARRLTGDCRVAPQ